MITAVAGGLYAHYLGSIGPGSFDLSITFLIIAMLVVGGMRSLTGAVVGAVFISAVTTVLNNWEQGQTVLGIAISLPAATTELAVAAMLVVVLILRPDGLTGGPRAAVAGATAACRSPGVAVGLPPFQVARRSVPARQGPTPGRWRPRLRLCERPQPGSSRSRRSRRSPPASPA